MISSSSVVLSSEQFSPSDKSGENASSESHLFDAFIKRLQIFLSFSFLHPEPLGPLFQERQLKFWFFRDVCWISAFWKQLL